MPQNLTDTSTFDTVTGPSASDVRNAAGVRSHLQTLANRTRFLADRTSALININALKAIASPTDGLVRLVKQYGLYVFDSSSVDVENWPFVVQPNAGSGRWLHELYSAKGMANGLAYLNSSQQLSIQGSTDYPTFETTRTITRVLGGDAVYGATSAVTTKSRAEFFYGSEMKSSKADIQNGWLLVELSASASVNQLGFGVALDNALIDGATLSSVTVYLISGTGRASLPAVMPTFGVHRTSKTAITAVDLVSAGFTADAAVLATYNSATPHSWSATCNQNNIIDRSQYKYYLTLWDEASTNARANNLYMFQVTMSVAKLRP